MADPLTERCWFCTKLCDAERGCLVAPEAYAGHDVLACSDNHFNRAYEMAMGMKPANRTFYDFARVAERRDEGRGKDGGFRIKEIIFAPNFPPYRRDELSKSLRAENLSDKEYRQLLKEIMLSTQSKGEFEWAVSEIRKLNKKEAETFEASTGDIEMDRTLLKEQMERFKDDPEMLEAIENMVQMYGVAGALNNIEMLDRWLEEWEREEKEEQEKNYRGVLRRTKGLTKELKKNPFYRSPFKAETFEANSIPYNFNKMPAIFKSWRRNTAYCINDGNENTLCGTGDRWSSWGHGSAGLHKITCQRCKSKWNKLNNEDIERIEEAWERNGFMDSSWYGAETFEASQYPSLKLTENQESKLRWFKFAYYAHSIKEHTYIDEVLGDISPNLWTQATTVGLPFTIEKISRESIMRNASKASDDENAKRMQKRTLSQLVKKGIFEVNESFEDKGVPFTINVKLTPKAEKAVKDDIDDLRSLVAETFEADCRDCYGTGGLYDSRLGIDDECATCGGTGESFEADGGIQVAEGYNEWWDELDAIRNEYPPDKFFNRRLGNPKWEDVILEQLYKDGWTPRQALYTWKFYTGQAFAFRVKPDERKMELYEYKLKPQKCGNCGGIGHNRRSCSASRNDPDFDKGKADRNKDGEISDWERAVGNAVAKGIREHKGKKGAENFEAEIYDRQGNLRTVDDNFIEATNDKLQALHRLLEANRKQILATNNQDTKTRLREERYRIQDAMAQLREFIDDPINHDGGDFMVRLGAETFEAEQIQYDVMKGKFAKGHEYANYISLHDSYEEAEAVAKRERKKLEKDEAIFIVEESFDDETFELDTTLLKSISKSPMIESFPDASKDSFGAEGYKECCTKDNIRVHHRGGAIYHDDEAELTYYPAECMVCGRDYEAGLPMYSSSTEIVKLDAEALVIPDGDSVPYHILKRLDKEGIRYRWIEGNYDAETFEAPIMPFNRSGRPCPSCRSWSQSFIGGVCSRCANKDRKNAESVSDLELKKDSCCCGATKKTPCVCMILGRDCSANKPMCACYMLKAIQQKDEKGAETFEAKGDDKYYINNRPQWMPKLMKGSVEKEEEGTYSRHDKGYVAGLFLKSVEDARLNGILKQTNYQDSDVVGFIMPFDLITRKIAKDYEPLVLKDNFGKSNKYLVINGTPYNYDVFNSMLMRLPPTTEVRISGKSKNPLMFEFKFLNEHYLMFLAPYVVDAPQHGDYAKEVMSKSGAGFGFKSPLPENWDEQKKMSKELKDKQLREDIEKVVAVGHSYDPSKEPLSLSPPVPQWNEGNDPDFDPEKADRDNDGEISDWERAVGNAVAKGIREHKEKKEAESRPVSYMVKSDAHKLNEASKRIHDKADEKREYPEWWKSKLSVVRNDADKLSDFLDYAVVEGVFESEGDHDHEEIDELIDKLNTVVDFAITFVHDGGYGGEPKGILVDEDLGIKTEVVHYIEGSIQLNLVRDIDTNELLSVRFSLTGDPDQTPIVYLPLPEEITTVPEDDRVSAKN